MNAIDFAGPDEKLEKRLSDFAAALWGKCRRDPRGGWMLAFGIGPVGRGGDIFVWFPVDATARELVEHRLGRNGRILIATTPFQNRSGA